MTDTTKIPEPGPARDRLVAEVLGWKMPSGRRNVTCYRPDGSGCDVDNVPHYSTSHADALAALEAWRLADPSRRAYAIDSPHRSPDDREDYPDFVVTLYPALLAVNAPAISAAITAALLATREGT